MRKPEREAILEHGPPLGVAMQHGPRRGARVLPQHREKIRLRIALVQEEGLLLPLRKAKLQFECPPLLGRRREIPEIVEPAFTRRDDHGIGATVR